MRKGRITTTIALMLLSASLMFAADAESLYSDFHQAVDNGDVAQAIETYANQKEKEGWELITCSITPSARAILIFRTQ